MSHPVPSHLCHLRFDVTSHTPTFDATLRLQRQLRRALSTRRLPLRMRAQVRGALLMLGAGLLDVDPQAALREARQTLLAARAFLYPSLRGSARRCFTVGHAMRVVAHHRFSSRRVVATLRNVGVAEVRLLGLRCSGLVLPLPAVLPPRPWWRRRAQVTVSFHPQTLVGRSPVITWILD